MALKKDNSQKYSGNKININKFLIKCFYNYIHLEYYCKILQRILVQHDEKLDMQWIAWEYGRQFGNILQ